jgi:cytosine/uracil/thiamine/allantoin permease
VRWLYDYAWFIGFVVAGGLYCLLMQRSFLQQRVPLLK